MSVRAIAEIPGLAQRFCAQLCTQKGAIFPPFISFPAGRHAGRDCPPPRNRSQNPISEEFTAANMYTGREGEGFAPKHDETPKHIRFQKRARVVSGSIRFNQKEALQ